MWETITTVKYVQWIKLMTFFHNTLLSRWPKGISSAADNAIFKNNAQNMEYSFGCVARGFVLLQPNVANIRLFNFLWIKFIQHGPITIAIEFNGLSLLIFEEKCLNYASGPKSVPNSDSFRVLRLFNVCVRVFCALKCNNFACLHTRHDQNKLHLKRLFVFFAKIGIFCKSLAGLLIPALFKRIHNHIPSEDG